MMKPVDSLSGTTTLGGSERVFLFYTPLRKEKEMLKEVPAKRGKLKKNKRKSIIQDYDNKCYYCGQEHDPVDLQLDHVIPIAQNGHSTDKDNLVPACERCNQMKANLTPDELRSSIKIITPEYRAIQYLKLIDQIVKHPFQEEFHNIEYWLNANIPNTIFYGESIGKKKEGKYA